MAEPNWSEYAKSYAGYGGPEAQMGSTIGAGIGAGLAAIPRIEEKLNTSAQEALEMSFSPLMDYVSLPVEQWTDIDTMGGMSGVPSAGSAYLQWKNSLSPRHQRIAKRKGLLNPVAFKQMYDSQMEMILPEIKNKLNTYKTMNNKTNKDMRKFFKDRKGLNQFLLQNTSQEELTTTDMGEYLSPTRTWKQWAEQQGGALGLGVRGASIAGLGATGYGLGSSMYGRMGSPSGLTPKDMARAEKAAKSVGFGKEAIEASKGRKAKGIGKAEGVLKRAQTKYNKAEKAYKGKRFSTTKQAKGLKDKIDLAKGKVSTARSKEVQNVKGLLNKVIKKHGKSGVIRHLGKKLGAGGAVRMLGKLGLGFLPGAQAISGTLLAADLYFLYRELKKLAE